MQKLHEANDSLGSAKLIETKLNMEVKQMREERDITKLRHDKILGDFKIKVNDCDNM